MMMAPSSDLKFSQSQRPIGDDPPLSARARATALDGRAEGEPFAGFEARFAMRGKSSALARRIAVRRASSSNAAGGRAMRTSPLRVQTSGGLLDVLVDELGHLEHRDLALATEYRLELVVGVDHATLLRVLEAVPLDVAPELLRDLGAGHHAAADYRTERRIRLHWLHERRVRRTLGAFLCALLGAAALRGLAGLLGSAFLAGLFAGLLTTLLCSHSLSREVEWLG